jgi:ribosome-binding protein aMBF1 (putative translation factor)
MAQASLDVTGSGVRSCVATFCRLQIVKCVNESSEADLASLRTRYRLARELLDARCKRGFTQAHLAELTGIDQADISRIEAGAANPTLETLSVLGVALGVDLHALTPEQASAIAAA